MNLRPNRFQGQSRFVDRQLSFTLFETIVAVGLLATVIVNVSMVQGNSLVFSEYTRNLTHAIWLSKRIMSQVEYHKTINDFKSLETEIEDETFQDVRDEDSENFLYDLAIVPFDFPITKLVTKHFSGELSGGEDAPASPLAQIAPLVEQQMEQYLGKDFFKLVKLNVKWSDGAREDSLVTQMLIADIKKLDEVFAQLSALSGAGGQSPAGIPGLPGGAGLPQIPGVPGGASGGAGGQP